MLSHGTVASADLLSSAYMEAEGCWVFFLNERLHLPNRPGELTFTAYAVAKSGGQSALIYDFRPNQEQMQSYVELWSLYALGKQQEANAALKSFLGKYPPDNLAYAPQKARKLIDRLGIQLSALGT